MGRLDAAWTPMIANIGYAVTFGAHDPTILARSVVMVVALPVLLLLSAPAFFTSARRKSHPAESDRPLSGLHVMAPTIAPEPAGPTASTARPAPRSDR